MAHYSRPPHQNDFYSEQEQQDLTETLPPLSLKFSLPPVDNVSPCDAGDGIQSCGSNGDVSGIVSDSTAANCQPSQRQNEAQQQCRLYSNQANHFIFYF